jgi:hypothetical protein
METEILHVRFDVVEEVEGRWCCSNAMNRAMVMSADLGFGKGRRCG